MDPKFGLIRQYCIYQLFDEESTQRTTKVPSEGRYSLLFASRQTYSCPCLETRIEFFGKSPGSVHSSLLRGMFKLSIGGESSRSDGVDGF